jgi:hypothetical protein
MISTNQPEIIRTAIDNYEAFTLNEVYALFPDETNKVAALVCAGLGPTTEAEFIEAVIDMAADHVCPTDSHVKVGLATQQELDNCWHLSCTKDHDHQPNSYSSSYLNRCYSNCRNKHYSHTKL